MLHRKPTVHIEWRRRDAIIFQPDKSTEGVNDTEDQINNIHELQGKHYDGAIVLYKNQVDIEIISATKNQERSSDREKINAHRPQISYHHVTSSSSKRSKYKYKIIQRSVTTITQEQPKQGMVPKIRK